MCKHENKICPRCQTVFECRAADISNCQCYSIQLNEQERAFLENNYHDCLCADCINAIKITIVVPAGNGSLPRH